MLDLERVPVPPIFRWLADVGEVAEAGMLRTFNCGVGMVAVVAPGEAGAMTQALVRRKGGRKLPVGEVVAIARDTARVACGHLDLAWWCTLIKKRVAVLISGRGSQHGGPDQDDQGSFISG